MKKSLLKIISVILILLFCVPAEAADVRRGTLAPPVLLSDQVKQMLQTRYRLEQRIMINLEDGSKKGLDRILAEWYRERSMDMPAASELNELAERFGVSELLVRQRMEELKYIRDNYLNKTNPKLAAELGRGNTLYLSKRLMWLGYESWNNDQRRWLWQEFQRGKWPDPFRAGKKLKKPSEAVITLLELFHLTDRYLFNRGLKTVQQEFLKLPNSQGYTPKLIQRILFEELKLRSWTRSDEVFLWQRKAANQTMLAVRLNKSRYAVRRKLAELEFLFENKELLSRVQLGSLLNVSAKTVLERIRIFDQSGHQLPETVLDWHESRQKLDMGEEPKLASSVVQDDGLINVSGLDLGYFKKQKGLRCEVRVMDGFPLQIRFSREREWRDLYPVFDAQGELIEFYLNKIGREKFIGFGKVIIITRLGREGQLSLAGGKPRADGTMPEKQRPWAKLGVSQGRELAAVSTEKGVVFSCFCLASNRDFPFSLVYRRSQGQYVSSYWGKLYPEELNLLNDDFEIHNHLLSRDGSLFIGGTEAANFGPDCGYSRADLFGFIKGAGGKTIVGACEAHNGKRILKRLNILYELDEFGEQTRQPAASFEKFSPSLAESVSGGYVVKTRFSASGNIWFFEKSLIHVPALAGAEAEVKINQGGKRYLKLLRDGEGNPITYNGENHLIDLDQDVYSQLNELPQLRLAGEKKKLKFWQNTVRKKEINEHNLSRVIKLCGSIKSNPQADGSTLQEARALIFQAKKSYQKYCLARADLYLNQSRIDLAQNWLNSIRQLELDGPQSPRLLELEKKILEKKRFSLPTRKRFSLMLDAVEKHRWKFPSRTIRLCEKLLESPFCGIRTRKKIIRLVREVREEMVRREYQRAEENFKKGNYQIAIRLATRILEELDLPLEASLTVNNLLQDAEHKVMRQDLGQAEKELENNKYASARRLSEEVLRRNGAVDGRIAFEARAVIKGIDSKLQKKTLARAERRLEQGKTRQALELAEGINGEAASPELGEQAGELIRECRQILELEFEAGLKKASNYFRKEQRESGVKLCRKILNDANALPEFKEKAMALVTLFGEPEARKKSFSLRDYYNMEVKLKPGREDKRLLALIREGSNESLSTLLEAKVPLLKEIVSSFARPKNNGYYDDLLQEGIIYLYELLKEYAESGEEYSLLDKYLRRELREGLKKYRNSGIRESYVLRTLDGAINGKEDSDFTYHNVLHSSSPEDAILEMIDVQEKQQSLLLESSV